MLVNSGTGLMRVHLTVNLPAPRQHVLAGHTYFSIALLQQAFNSFACLHLNGQVMHFSYDQEANISCILSRYLLRFLNWTLVVISRPTLSPELTAI